MEFATGPGAFRLFTRHQLIPVNPILTVECEMKIGTAVCVLFSLCLLPSFSPPARAEEPEDVDVPRIEESVVVSASLQEIPVEWAGNAVTVLTGEELARRGSRNLTEAVAVAPGLQINTTGAGGVSTLMIRGAASDETLVMIDGIALNDPTAPGRGYELGTLSLDNVERIEIVRGPQSVLFGSDAMGGVVNIVTKSGDGPRRAMLQVEGGSYGWLRAGGEASANLAGFRFSAGASLEQIDGWSAASDAMGNREGDGQDVKTLNFKIMKDFGRGFQAVAAVHANQFGQDLDSYGGSFGDDPNYRADGRESAFLGELRHTSAGGTFQQRFQFSWLDSHTTYTDPEDEAHAGSSSYAYYRGIRKKMRWQADWTRFRRHFLSFGYEYAREQGHSLYESSSAWWGDSVSVFPDTASVMHSLFFEERLQLGDKFSVTGGVRLDHNDSYDSAFTFRVSPVWVVPGLGSRVRFSIGTGFKAPSLYQRFAPASEWGPVGNPGLLPEENWSLEAGYIHPFEKIRLQLSAGFFLSRFKNLIEYAYGYQNVGRASSQGVELEGKWSPRDDLAFFASYTLTDARNVLTEEPLIRRSRHTASLGLEYRRGKNWSASAELRFRGARDDMDYNAWPYARVRLDPQTVVNLSVTKRVGDNAELYLRADNIFSNSVPDVYGYTADPFVIRAGIRLIVMK